MKNYIIFALALVLSSCKYHKKALIQDSKIDIACYRIYSDSIDIESKYPLNITMKAVYGDTLKFIYYNEGLMDYIDTLTIYNPDFIVFRNELRFLYQKTLNFKGKSLMIKKYRKAGNLSATGNVYINDSLGLILDRHLSHPSGEHVFMYNTEEFSELHNAIINDSAFFASEWFD